MFSVSGPEAGRHCSWLDEWRQRKGGKKMWTRLGSAGALATIAFVVLSTTAGADTSTETSHRETEVEAEKASNKRGTQR